MKQNILRLTGATTADRNDVIGRINRAILEGGGFVMDSKMFSNISMCFNFEVSVGSLGKFYSSITKETILDEMSLDLLACWRDQESQGMPPDAGVTGTLNMTFIHNEPDLRIETPPIPG